jgi:hypothetical protein
MLVPMQGMEPSGEARRYATALAEISEDRHFLANRRAPVVQ